MWLKWQDTHGVNYGVNLGKAVLITEALREVGTLKVAYSDPRFLGENGGLKGSFEPGVQLRYN